MLWIVLSMLGCHNPAIAQEAFNFDDTGTTDFGEELNHVDLWPAKIVLDSSQNQFKLVWFETESPRHTNILLQDIAKLQHIPSFEGHIQELQIHLTDGRTFLLDKGPTTRKTAQTFAVLAKVTIDEAKPKSKRLVPKPTPERPSPVLVIGSIDGPDVLKPPSKTKIVTEVEIIEDPTLDTEFDNATLSSAVEKTTIDQTIKSNMGRFRSCFTSDTRQSTTLSGRIDVKFTIDKSGAVIETTIASSSVNSPSAEQCVMQQLKGLKFTEQPNERNESVYPFVFSQQ